MEKKEIWKDVPEYCGSYKVSNLGRVKSLSRTVKSGFGNRVLKEKILKQSFHSDGYLVVNLSQKGKAKVFKVHKLVAITFLNHVPCGFKLVIDHINNVKTDNNLSNMQIITNRENATKDRSGGTSGYIGVSWCKALSKWRSVIKINRINIHLGYFICELAAAKSYQDKLRTLKHA